MNWKSLTNLAIKNSFYFKKFYRTNNHFFSLHGYKYCCKYFKNDPRVVSFYPDNCSITEIENKDGKLNLISTGNELQTHVN